MSTRVFVTVTLDVDTVWFDGLDDDRPQDVVAEWVGAALETVTLFAAGRIVVVRCEASELP